MPLLEDYNPGDVETIHAVFLDGANIPARIRVFVDFLAKRLSGFVKENQGICTGFRQPHAGSRSPSDGRSDVIRPFAFDLLNEPSIAAAADKIAQQGPVDLVIVATGILHGTACQPEKSFSSVTGAAINTLFQINTVGPTLIAKHMIAALPRDRRSVFAALSARVGSINDNHLGGWHSYRASKAALSMIIANLAIEFRRTRPLAIAIGLHPGTVDSKLSAPFQKNVPARKLFLTSTSAQYLITVINGT